MSRKVPAVVRAVKGILVDKAVSAIKETGGNGNICRQKQIWVGFI